MDRIVSRLDQWMEQLPFTLLWELDGHNRLDTRANQLDIRGTSNFHLDAEKVECHTADELGAIGRASSRVVKHRENVATGAGDHKAMPHRVGVDKP